MSEIADDTMMKAEAARSIAYGLVASAYNQLPRHESILRFRAEEVRAMFQPFIEDDLTSVKLRGDLEQGLITVEKFWSDTGYLSEEELITRLSVDRTRLFRGLNREGPPPPYESVRMGSTKVMTESTVQVSDIYGQLQYCPPQGLNDLPDYIGIELDFIRYLCIEAAIAFKEGNENKALALLEQEKDFLCGHILKWVPAFCDEVMDRAKEDLYSGMAQITKTFILIEAERIGCPPNNTKE
jgi:TorA maturation chaperone TorD